MLLHLKLRIGAILIVVGGLLAAFGELLNLWNTDPTTGGWFASMGLIALGVLVFIYGLNMYTQLSDKISLLGLLGAVLLFVGGLLTIVGSISVNMVVLPMLLGIAATIAAAVNAPGAAAQTATNTVTSGINTVTNGAANFFGQGSNNASIPSVTVPSINGLDIVNRALTGMHLPSFAQISQWGHIFSTGGLLTVGGLLLGFALLRAKAFSVTTCYIVMAAAAIGLLGQFLTPIFPIAATITGILLFASLAWLGCSILWPQATGKLSLALPFLSKTKHAH